jgi:SWI/SNF chromatin-remodeling complex subunit SWI1
MEHDVQGFQLIVHRALSVLRRLGEKSKGEVLVKGVHNQANGHAQNGHRRKRSRGLDSDSDSDSDDDDMETITTGGKSFKVKASVIPKRETLLSALLTPSLDASSLKQFCGIGYLDGMA